MSCGRDQFAREDSDLGHGVFIHFILEGLSGKAADDDGVVSLMRLADYASRSTEKYVHKKFNAPQTPFFRGDVAGTVELASIDRTKLPPKSAPIKPGETITNSIGMKLTLVPAGEFIMGSPDSEVGYSNGEKLHRVRLTKPFYMGVYEVTQAEYQNVIGSNPSWFSRTSGGKDKVAGQDTSRFPVERVSLDDAQEFCRKLSQKEGKTYRLPTEAEWEYACCAGTTTPFNFGEQLNGTQADCNGSNPYGTSAKGPNLQRPCTVGQYQPNAFGLYDMHGNVWQWCQDWYDKDYYSEFLADNPKGPDSGTYRVIRGGSWDSLPGLCCAAYRFRDTPSGRSSLVGFRVVCEQ